MQTPTARSIISLFLGWSADGAGWQVGQAERGKDRLPSVNRGVALGEVWFLVCGASALSCDPCDRSDGCLLAIRLYLIACMNTKVCKQLFADHTFVLETIDLAPQLRTGASETSNHDGHMSCCVSENRYNDSKVGHAGTC